MEITKRWLKNRNACSDSFQWFLEQNITDAKGLFDLALKEKRYSDINWVLTRKMNKKQLLRYAIFAAELVISNFERYSPDDDRPQKAIEAAKNYLRSPSTMTRSAARSAGSAAWSAAESATYIKILSYGFNLLMEKEK